MNELMNICMHVIMHALMQCYAMVYGVMIVSAFCFTAHAYPSMVLRSAVVRMLQSLVVRFLQLGSRALGLYCLCRDCTCV